MPRTNLPTSAAALPTIPHLRLLLAGLALALGLSPACRAQAISPDQGRTKIITLGTAGGPPPRAQRAQVSTLLMVNGVSYLVDAGDGVLRRMAENKIAYTSVGKIFLTHLHDDHYSGLAPLISLEWQFGKGAQIDVYGPPGTHQAVAGALQYLSPHGEIREEERKLAPIVSSVHAHELASSGQVYADDNVKVYAAENTHFHFGAGGNAAKKFKSYSYRFQTPDRVVVFTGDTGPSDAVAELARGADVLVSEVISADDYLQAMTALARAPLSEEQKQRNLFHMTEEHLIPEEVGKLAAKAGVKTVILTHFPPRINGNDDFTNYIPLVKKHFDGEVLIAEDGKVF